MRGARGFVLVNALVLVAALAAMATLLLGRAETGRAQLAAAAGAQQIEAYLDAFEVLALRLIDADPGPADHPGEAWAAAEYNVPLDRGRVAGGLTDLQARFNVNWLADPEDLAAREAFDRLLAGLGLSSQLGDAVAAALAPGGPGQAVQMGGARGLLPGGALPLIGQLPLGPRDRARLAPWLVALPGDAAININTAPPEVLAAVLPGVGPARLAALAQGRVRQPVTSNEALYAVLTDLVGPDVARELQDRGRFSISSDWFAADITAELDGRVVRRRVVLRRYPLPGGAEVAYRLDRW